MTPALHVAWRGPLASCNYACTYCPFAKRPSSRDELRTDRRYLERFCQWVEGPGRPLTILFTPWGEALIRPWYRDALVRLSYVPRVQKVAIQTNLTCPLDFLERAAPGRVALWTTYHPSQIERSRFVERCRTLDRMGVRYSVGIVGLRENQDDARALRAELDPNVYLWINAYKSLGEDYYRDGEREAFAALDMLFPVNALRHPSRGRPCRTGEHAIMVDGDGTVRRCHFVPQILGNLYRDRLEDMLQSRPCPQATCGCHIGYVHMPELELERVFGSGMPERVFEAQPVRSPS